MARLLVRVLIEVVAAVSLAGLLLAVIVPLLNRYQVAEGGDTVTALVIAGVIVAVTLAVIFRPGGAFSRRKLQ
jgi:uncharacterized membrane-anchored protein YitT (DUF2179 family)